MKNKISTLLILFSFSLFITSCSKEGTGGTTDVATIVKHHEKVIPGATVYVKYGAKDFPGEDVSKYDASKVVDKNGHVHFDDLKKGNYYFYGVGYDSSIAMIVKGGTPMDITRKHKNQHVDLIVAVTE
jgi:hypothetical protein